MKRYRKALVIGGVLLVFALVWAWFRPAARWRRSSRRELNAALLNYTVPFTNYREHAGIMWLFNHARVTAPHLADRWDLPTHYVGYNPNDRERPTHLPSLTLSQVDLIYVADTYGVYRDDLAGIPTQTSHMDYNPLVFGGLHEQDAEAMERVFYSGGSVWAEFNTFCEPTTKPVRERMEALFHLQWSEWVGRVFVDPYDPNDVPRWLPREFAQQYPGQELPRSPILILTNRDGVLKVFPSPKVETVVPRVKPTARGLALGLRDADSPPYFFWFALMRAKDPQEVHARFDMPKLWGLDDFLKQIAVEQAPPALIVQETGKGRSVYFAADFADIDFDPGPFDEAGLIQRNADLLGAATGPTSAHVFWQFYAPAVMSLLDATAPVSR